MNGKLGVVRVRHDLTIRARGQVTALVMTKWLFGNVRDLTMAWSRIFKGNIWSPFYFGHDHGQHFQILWQSRYVIRVRKGDT